MTQRAQPSGKDGGLLTVSNRGPVEFERDGEGKIIAVEGSGGLSTALRTASQMYRTTWLSSPLTPLDREIAEKKATPGEAHRAAHFVSTDPEAYDLFYGSFSNEVLWFLQHNLPWPEEITDERRAHAWADGYQVVNRAFADAIVEELETGSYRAVMFHDYHFYLAPLMVRQRRPEAYLQHFIHIPWPEPAVWARQETETARAICEGLLANDSLVFQTPDSARNFALCCEEFVPKATVDLDAGTVRTGRRTTRVWANGISSDPDELLVAAASPEFSRFRYLLRADPGQKTIVRVDRLDPTKNILAGFQAYVRLLEEHPELREKVNFLAQIVPSRSDIEVYQRYGAEVHALADSINARFGSHHWKPIKVYFEHNRMQALAAMSLYDVLLVNPVADGMNLVAKEGPMLNMHDGVLVLSRRAGAYSELGCAAIGIDPLDVEETAQALYTGLKMPAEEKRERSRRLRQVVHQRTLRDWFRALLDDIETNARCAPASSAA